MKNEIISFTNEEFGEIRSILIDNEPWFVGKDIAGELGYSDTNKAVAMHVELEDKKLNDKTSPSFGQRGTTLINESGLYSLILSSKLPTAKKFKRWVTSEVLPSIRKTGKYSITPKDYATALRELADKVEENERLKLENKQQNQMLKEAKPKVDYYDLILQSTGLVTVTQIAKDYGMSAKRLNQILSDLKIQYKQSGQWFLYSRYQNKGYTKSVTVYIDNQNTRLNTKWTQKGRLFLYELLKSNNIYPVMELEN